jgi:1,4-dihydroxy-2-naphthoyl-CoA synthase
LGENIMVSNLDFYNAKEGLASFAEKRKPKWEEF